MNLNDHVEAVARRRFERRNGPRFDWAGASEEMKAYWLKDARQSFEELLPELFTSPPTMWLAPMTPTPEMLRVGFLTDERMGMEKQPGSTWRPLNEPTEVITQVFEDMRDAHLNREGK